MTKPVIITRLGKGSELTFSEGDANFTNLRDATINVSADSGSTQNIELNGTITVTGGTGLSTAATTGTVTVNLDNTAVTPGSYTNANVTVDAQGRITSAANGFSGSYTDLTNKPTLGTASAQDVGYFATAAQGALASTAVQPGSLATVATSGSYSDLTNKPSIPTAVSQLTNDSGYITGINSSAVTTALGYTPENPANKNTANGYAGLDASGKVASAQLPSYVDDVLEYANQAGFPGTGETGKIYVALDTGKVYRWSGSAYVEISPSPGTTDSLTEGTTNLYFTTQRARDAFSASTGITITNGAIATTITQYADSNARSAISVTDSGGDGSLSYDNSTGVITYTGPGTTEYRAAFSAGTGISITDGVIANTASAGITDVVQDTTPQLGGNLDANGKSIVDSVNGTVNINGFAYGSNQTVGGSGSVPAVNAQDRLQINATPASLGLAVDDAVKFSGSSAITYSGGTQIVDGVIYYVSLPFGSSQPYISLWSHPSGNPSRVQVATQMNTGSLTGVTFQIIDFITPTSGQVLKWNGSAFLPAADSGIASVSADTAPTLGGNLTVGGFSIISASNGNIAITPNGTGQTLIKNLEYNENIFSLGTTSGTIAPDVANGNVQTITLNGNLTLNAFTNPIAGQSLTLIVNTGGTGRTLTSTMKFAGGTKTLSTTSTTDIISVFYDGTNYWASLSTDFK